MAKRVGLLTSGGDAPAENYCLKTIVEHATRQGYEIVGIRKGWEGLIRYNLDDPVTHTDNAQILTPARLHNAERLKASFLHSSRLIPDQVELADVPSFLAASVSETDSTDLTDHVMAAVNHLALETLVVMGDTPSLQYAASLSRKGVPIIGVPVSVQNDVPASMYSLGSSTVAGRSVELIHELKDLAASREAILAVAVQGYGSGLSTLLIATFAGVDRVLIPEAPFDPERLARLLLDDKRVNPNNYALLLVNDGARIDPNQAPNYSADLDADLAEVGMRASAARISRILGDLTRQRVLLQPLSYIVYTGRPDGWDLLTAVNFGTIAANLITAGKSGRMTSYMIDQGYMDVPLEDVTGKIPWSTVEFYDVETYTPKASVIFQATVGGPRGD